MDRDRRIYPRHALMRPALIKLAQGREVACTLQNISKVGAMLSLDVEFDLPPTFILDLSGNILVERECELIWQEEKLAGVKFPVIKGAQSAHLGL